MTTRQALIHYDAYCLCGASCHARNALAWAHNHVRLAKAGEHRVTLSLGFAIEKVPVS